MSDLIKAAFMAKNLTTAKEVQQAEEINQLLSDYLDYWRALQPREWSAFVAFAKSPIHKENAYSPLLIERIKEAWRKGTSELRGEDLLARFTASKASDSFSHKLDLLQSEFKTLLALIKKFLVYEEAMESSLGFNRLLVKSLKSRNAEHLFESSVQALRKKIAQLPFSVDAASELWWLDQQVYYRQKAQHVSNKELFKRNLESSQLLFELTILRDYLEHLNRNFTVEEEDTYGLAHKAKHVFSQNGSNEPLFQLYLLAIRLLEQRDQADWAVYQALKAAFEEAQSRLAEIDKLIFSKICFNFSSIAYYQKGDPVLLEEMFFWMEYADLQGLYTYEGGISEDEFINHAFVALAIGEFEKYEAFEAKYSPMLDLRWKDQVIGLCRANYLQRRGKPTEALEELDRLFPIKSREELKYNLRVKGLRVMLSYEIMTGGFQEEEPISQLDKSLDNLSKFCQRLVQIGKMSAEAVEPQNKFRAIVQKMARYHLEVEEGIKENLLSEINRLLEGDNPVAYRSWLREQLRRLTGG